MTAPKTASDGSEHCGHEGHFDVSQQQTPKLEARVRLEKQNNSTAVVSQKTAVLVSVAV